MHGPEIETFELPFGQDYLWMAEWNTLVFAPHLDATGRQRALTELQEKWRLCVIGDDRVLRVDPAA